MKKTSIILGSCILSGCANFSETMVHAMDKMGFEDPTGVSQMQKAEQENREKNRLRMPVIKVKEDFPEGEFIKKDEAGRVEFKTFVQNGCFDKYIDIYYPNGELRTHTPLVDCKANGVSQGFLVNGVLRTEIPYKDSYAQGDAKVFDKDGQVIETKTFIQGYPVKAPSASK